MNKNFIRIISRLDIKNNNLIKGINLEGLRILGEPLNFANIYSKHGVDEICYVDNVVQANILAAIANSNANIFNIECNKEVLNPLLKNNIFVSL
jgi:imidazole glycerol phosphate synthase subunit HisF